MKPLRTALRSAASRIGLRSGGAAPQPRTRQVWSIGIFSGRSLLDLGPSPEAANPVLSPNGIRSLDAAFVADPFALRNDGTWHLFCEVWNRTTRKGEIGHATSDDGLAWAFQSIVVAEPFHLSYPYVFEWQNEYFMIPECGATRSVRLYRAIRFPTVWRYERTLLEGLEFADPSVVHWDDRWWLFSGDFSRRTHDELRLYSAESLLGPWREHPKSPVIQGDPRIARPAGRLVAADGGIVRFAQDCLSRYGTSVSAFRVTTLSQTDYEEEPVQAGPILRGSGEGWNAAGMHHIDPHVVDGGQYRAFVDGWTEVDV